MKTNELHKTLIGMYTIKNIKEVARQCPTHIYKFMYHIHSEQ